MAFGSILDGPNEKMIVQLVESAIGFLIDALSDSQVRLLKPEIFLLYLWV